MIVMVISLLTHTVYAAEIEITEVELNPEGSDSGEEWIELFSNDELNLAEYSVKNADEDVINLTGKIDGVYVVELESQWLDNSDEIVYLFKNNEIIDETDELSDNDNDDNTWRLCDGDWIFGEESKDEENPCDSNADEEDEELKPPVEIERIEDRVEKESESDAQNKVVKSFVEKNEKIVLNSNAQSSSVENIEEEPVIQDVQKEPGEILFLSRHEKLRFWIVVGFMVFAVVLIIGLSMKKI